MERAGPSRRSGRTRSPVARTRPALEQPVAVSWLSGGIGPSTRDFTTNATEDLRASASYSWSPTTTTLTCPAEGRTHAHQGNSTATVKPTAGEPHAFKAARRAFGRREQAARVATGRRGRARTSQALARKTQARVPRERRQGVRRPQVGPKARALTGRWEDAPGRAPNGCCRRARRHCGLCPSARTSNRAAGNRTRAADHSRHHLPAGKRRAARRRHDKHGDNTPGGRGFLLVHRVRERHQRVLDRLLLAGALHPFPRLVSPPSATCASTGSW
jgi:hypothetical protein